MKTGHDTHSKCKLHLLQEKSSKTWKQWIAVLNDAKHGRCHDVTIGKTDRELAGKRIKKSWGKTKYINVETLQIHKLCKSVWWNEEKQCH